MKQELVGFDGICGKTVKTVNNNWQLDRGGVYIEFTDSSFLHLTAEHSGDGEYDVIDDMCEIPDKDKAILGVISWADYHDLEKGETEARERRILEELKIKYD